MPRGVYLFIAFRAGSERSGTLRMARGGVGTARKDAGVIAELGRQPDRYAGASECSEPTPRPNKYYIRHA
jgi:hypothetical protein